MAITFDPVAKRIILDTASTTWAELYSRSCDWLATDDNVKYGAVFRQVGSDDLGSGLSIPPYFFLQGAWRVRPMEADHDLTIDGNGFVDGGGTPVVRTLGQYQVNVKYVVPVQAQGVLTGVAALNATAVWGEKLEAGMSAAELFRLLTAFIAGNGAGLDGTTPEFKSIDGTKTRLAATYAGGVRTMALRDGT
jgi:hypothetical protein